MRFIDDMQESLVRDLRKSPEGLFWLSGLFVPAVIGLVVLFTAGVSLSSV